MSALGIAGLAQFPYFGLLYPVLLTMLGLHLLLLARHGRHTGYGPLIVSVCGACVILLTRASASEETWALRSGVVAMLAGSLWHSFSMKWRTHVPPSTPVIHKPIQQHL